MTYATASARAEMSELRRLKTLLPPELQSWVMVEGTTEVNPPLIRSEELGRDEIEIQIDLAKWENLAIDQRNLIFWHEVAQDSKRHNSERRLGNGCVGDRFGRCCRRTLGSGRFAAAACPISVRYFWVSSLAEK